MVNGIQIRAMVLAIPKTTSCFSNLIFRSMNDARMGRILGFQRLDKRGKVLFVMKSINEC